MRKRSMNPAFAFASRNYQDLVLVMLFIEEGDRGNSPLVVVKREADVVKSASCLL